MVCSAYQTRRVFPPQPSELALPAARRVAYFVNHKAAAARSILARSTCVTREREWSCGASRTPGDAPQFARGWPVAPVAPRRKRHVKHHESRMNEISRKPAHAAPLWQAPASTSKNWPAIEERAVEGGQTPEKLMMMMN